MDLIPCPTCGHPNRVLKEDALQVVVCAECAEAIKVPAQAKPRRSRSRAARDSAEDRDWRLRLVRSTLGDPAVALEGAIPGALGGIFAGVLVGTLYAVVEAAAPGNAAGAPGDGVGRVLTGFVVGFGLGALGGALLASLHPADRAPSPARSDRHPFIKGAVIGLVVALVVGSYLWIPFGIAAGVGGAGLWQWLTRVAEPPPPVAKTAIGEEDYSHRWQARMETRRHQDN